MGRNHICRVCVAIGTRPEAIKAAPVIRALRASPSQFETIVIATEQNRFMLDQVLKLLNIQVDDDLNLDRTNPALSRLTAEICQSMESRLARFQPDVLLVQGDTTSAFAAALAAFYQKVSVGHIEAGLRSHDNQNPFPEEANRRLVTVLSDLNFAPTPWARGKLVSEGVPLEKIVVTGNTVVDALLDLSCSIPESQASQIPRSLFEDHRVLLVTVHRREAWGPDLENICLAVKDLVSYFPDLAVLYPVHLNPVVRNTVNKMLGGVDRVHLVEPLDYPTFIDAMRRCHLILTDSGGVQEEAPTFHKPVLVLRKVTERPEASRHGMSLVVGMSRDTIVRHAGRLLADSTLYRAMSEGENPYGDGRAAERIVEALERWHRGRRPYLDPEKEFGVDVASRLRVSA
jgi:UDP-N-acetylglucosamine 2-epimerase (non-hydrolysing)